MKTGIEIPGDETVVTQESFTHLFDAIEAEIFNRLLDLVGPGIIRGGAVAPGTGSTVNLTEETVAYDTEGMRVKVPVTNGVTVPEGDSVLVIRYKQKIENFNNADAGADGSVNHIIHSYEILPRQGELDPLDVPLFRVTVTGGAVTIGEDMRDIARLSGHNLALLAGQVTDDKLGSDNKVGSLAALRTRIQSLDLAGAVNNVDERLENLEKNKKFLGELFPLLDRREASAEFPAFCISDPTQELAAADWPELVPLLRSLYLTIDPAGASQTEFEVESWSRTDNYTTLVLKDSPGEIAALIALLEDQLEHGSWTSWRPVLVPAGLGSVPAKEFDISGITVSGREIRIYDAGTATGATSGGGAKVKFPLYRVADNPDVARWYQINRMPLVAGNDANNLWLPGLRRRGRLEEHEHEDYGPSNLSSAAGSALLKTTYNDSNKSKTLGVKVDGENPPLVSDETHGPGLSVYYYLYARVYTGGGEA